MKENLFVALLLAIMITACGYDREEDKEMKRKEDLQELSQEMNNTLSGINNLKIQVRDSLANFSAQEDSLSRVKADKYRILMSELEQAEVAYKEWQREIEYEPTNMEHEEVMLYYENEEEEAEVLRQNMQKTIRYVESEIVK